MENVLNVLIVDDNLLFRKLLRQRLECRFPFLIISEAKEAREAMEIMLTSRPDLVFMDIRLPDGNGLDLTYQIKKRYPGIRIVIVTNYDGPEYRHAAFNCKADHYLAKDTFMSLFSSFLPEAHP